MIARGPSTEGAQATYWNGMFLSSSSTMFHTLCMKFVTVMEDSLSYFHSSFLSRTLKPSSATIRVNVEICLQNQRQKKKGFLDF